MDDTAQKKGNKGAQGGTSSSKAAAAAFLAAARSCRLPSLGPQDSPRQVGRPSALSTPRAFRPAASIAVAPFWAGMASSTTCMRAAMSTDGGCVVCMALGIGGQRLKLL